MGASTTISPDFKIDIPADVRKRQGWEAGQELVFLESENGVVLAPLPDFDRLRGIARGANPDGYRDRNDRY